MRRILPYVGFNFEGMKAIVCSNYGGPEVLQLKDVPKPICGKNELLIQVMATAVNSADVKMRAMAIPGYLKPLMRIVLGIRRPRKPILGTVYAGVVEAVGTQVRQFRKGDRVFGSTGFKVGAYAAYLTATDKSDTIYRMCNQENLGNWNPSALKMESFLAKNPSLERLARSVSQELYLDLVERLEGSYFYRRRSTTTIC